MGVVDFQLLAQEIPQMFDGIQICRTGQPVHAADFVLLWLVIDDPGPVQSDIVIMKNCAWFNDL